MQRIRRDDTVLITKGKDRGRTGTVRKVLLGMIEERDRAKFERTGYPGPVPMRRPG